MSMGFPWSRRFGRRGVGLSGGGNQVFFTKIGRFTDGFFHGVSQFVGWLGS